MQAADREESVNDDRERLRQERDLYRTLLDLGAHDSIETLTETALALVTRMCGARKGYLEIFDERAPDAAPLPIGRDSSRPKQPVLPVPLQADRSDRPSIGFRRDGEGGTAMDVLDATPIVEEREGSTVLVEPEGRVTVTWRSFELDPRADTTGERDYVTHLATKYGVDRPEAQSMIDRGEAFTARRMMIIADAVRFVVQGCAALLFLTGLPALWQVLVTTAVPIAWNRRHYLILAIPGEESSFVAALGDRYRECPRRVD